MPTYELPCPNCGQHMILVQVGPQVERTLAKFATVISGVN